MINRRHFFRGLIAVPVAAAAAPLAAALTPKPFESGGIVPHPCDYIIGECRLPVSTSIDKTRSKAGEIVVSIHCDTSKFDADMEAALVRALKKLRQRNRV